MSTRDPEGKEDSNAGEVRCPKCEAADCKKRFFGGSFGGGVVFSFLAFFCVCAYFGNPHPDPEMLLVAALCTLVAVMAFASKKYRCRKCGRAFTPETPEPPRKVKISCPQCGHRLKGATDAMIGDAGVCPHCGAEFEIRESR